MDKKIILSLLVVALIGIVAATYQINNGVDILNPLSNVEIEDTPVTETLEAPAEAATSLDAIAGSDDSNKEDTAKASDTEVENSEPVNTTTTTQANSTGSDANSTSNTSSSDNSQTTTAPTSHSGSNVQIESAGDTSGITEGQSGGQSSQSSSSSSKINVQNTPSTNAPSNNDNSNDQTNTDDDNEISIDSARSLVEQFILEKWSGNNVTLSYGTTTINDYGDKCYIYNMINDNGVIEGQASYNLRNQTIEIMDNSGAEYL